MEQKTHQGVKEKGWRVGTVSNFLDLSPEEEIVVEIKLALSRCLKGHRHEQMTQAELASQIGSSQLRVANAENSDESVSIELLIRAILATGASPQEIGKVIASVG